MAVAAGGIDELVLRLMHNDPSLSELRLAYNYIGDAGATGVGKALMSNAVLQKLSLASAHIGRLGIEELCKGVAHNRGVQGLGRRLTALSLLFSVVLLVFKHVEM